MEKNHHSQQIEEKDVVDDNYLLGVVYTLFILFQLSWILEPKYYC